MFLSPELQATIERVSRKRENIIVMAIKKRGLKKFERVNMRIDYKCEPWGVADNPRINTPESYPRLSGGGGVNMVIFKRKKVWTAWQPLIKLEIEGGSREKAIMNMVTLNDLFMEFCHEPKTSYILIEMQKHFLKLLKTRNVKSSRE